VYALGRYVSPMHLAGDYFAALGNLEAAAQSGLAAAERIDARLREVTHV
jgi:protoporphyrinogen/coproporphyrinogen III oxidase